jgi:hypothetical protein
MTLADAIHGFMREGLLFAGLLVALGGVVLAATRRRRADARRAELDGGRSLRPAVGRRASARPVTGSAQMPSDPGVGERVRTQPDSPRLRPAAEELSARATEDLRATVQEHELAALADRMMDARRGWFARSTADQQICALASEDVVVERDLVLGGRLVPHTLFTKCGVFAVMPLAGSTGEAETVRVVLADLRAVDAIVGDLSSLLGLDRPCAIKLAFFCPYADEAPRVWFGPRGHEAWTIGGIEQLHHWLADQPGPGLDRLALRIVREAAKPRRDEPGPQLIAAKLTPDA